MQNSYDLSIMDKVSARLAYSDDKIVFRNYIRSLREYDAELKTRPTEKMLYIYLQLLCMARISYLNDRTFTYLPGHAYVTVDEFKMIIGSSKLEMCKSVLDQLTEMGLITYRRLPVKEDRNKRYDIEFCNWSQYHASQATNEHIGVLQSGYIRVPGRIIKKLTVQRYESASRVSIIDRYLDMILHASYNDEYVTGSTIKPIFCMPERTNNCSLEQPVYSDQDMADYWHLNVQQSRNLLDKLINICLVKKTNLGHGGVYTFCESTAVLQFGHTANVTDEELRAAIIGGPADPLVQDTKKREIRDRKRRARRIAENISPNQIGFDSSKTNYPGKLQDDFREELENKVQQLRIYHNSKGSTGALSGISVCVAVSQILEVYCHQLPDILHSGSTHMLVVGSKVDFTSKLYRSFATLPVCECHLITHAAEGIYLFKALVDRLGNVISTTIDEFNYYTSRPVESYEDMDYMDEGDLLAFVKGKEVAS